VGLTRLAPTTRAWIALSVTVALVAGGLLALFFAEGLRGGHSGPATLDKALFAGAILQVGQGPLTFMPPPTAAPAANSPRQDTATGGGNNLPVLVFSSTLGLIAAIGMPWLVRRNGGARQPIVATSGYRPLPAGSPVHVKIELGEIGMPVSGLYYRPSVVAGLPRCYTASSKA